MSVRRVRGWALKLNATGDRGHPSCGWCVRNNQLCEYKERKKPGLRAGYGRELEARLGRLAFKILNPASSDSITKLSLYLKSARSKAWFGRSFKKCENASRNMLERCAFYSAFAISSQSILVRYSRHRIGCFRPAQLTVWCRQARGNTAKTAGNNHPAQHEWTASSSNVFSK